MPPLLEQDGDLLVRLLHQGHGPAGHRFEEAHVGLAANRIVEDEPAAIEDVDISVVESLAQVDRTAGAMGPARHARQQPVALAVQARVQVAAEGDVQIAGAARIHSIGRGALFVQDAEPRRVMPEQGLMEDVGDPCAAQQAVAGPIGEAEVEERTQIGKEPEADIPVGDEQHLGTRKGLDIPGDGEVLGAGADEDIRRLGGGYEREDVGEVAALHLGPPGRRAGRARGQVVPEAADGIAFHIGEAHIAEHPGLGGRGRGGVGHAPLSHGEKEPVSIP